MNNWFRASGTASVSRVTAALVCSLAAVGLPALGDTADDGPVSVTMTLMNNRVTLGEPVVLYYKLSSSSQQQVMLHMGKRDKTLDGPGADVVEMFRRDWLTMDMKTGTGLPMPALPGLRSPEKRDIEYSGVQSLFRGNRYAIDGYLVISQRYSPPQPGDYTLDVHVRLPYAALPEEEINPLTADKETLSAGTALSHDYTFPIVVQKPDPQRLKAVAEALQKAAVAETDGSRERMLIQSLFTMPEAQAGASWRALARDPRLSGDGKDSVANELVQLRSIRAADILAGMFPTAQEAADPNVTANFGSHYLEEMYRSGPAPLQRYISHLYAIHGFVFPAKPPQQVIPPGYVTVGRLSTQ